MEDCQKSEVWGGLAETQGLEAYFRANLSNFRVVFGKSPNFPLAPSVLADFLSLSVLGGARKTHPRERIILADFEKVTSFAHFTKISRSEKTFLRRKTTECLKIFLLVPSGLAQFLTQTV